jgi:hypothetical protein
MTMTVEPQSNGQKPKKTFAERLLERRDKGAAKIPKEDWDIMPADASTTVEDYLEGRL